MKKMNGIVFLFFFMSIFSLSCHTSHTNHIDIPKKTWIDIFSYDLKKVWCSQPKVKECFSVSEETCALTFIPIVDACLEKYSSQLPNEISTQEQEAVWGKKIGSCAGAAYARSLKDSFNAKNPQCLKHEQ